MATTLRQRTPDAAVNPFKRKVTEFLGEDLRGLNLKTLQVNVGLRCNLACKHCHVESSPKRTEEMSWETMALVLDAATACGAETLDITGGAPEMNGCFQDFVLEARSRGLRVVVRTNLTILLKQGFDHLPFIFKEQRVHLIASLPCYLEENVDRQRGSSVFKGSIEAIRLLNELGYGRDPELHLDLVYNPTGATLPLSQAALETDYRRELQARYGIYFSKLITITNMPIGRFQQDLERAGRAGVYRDLLESSFNSKTLPNLMCRHQISVRWDGTLFDCDFNLAHGLPVTAEHARHIKDFNVEWLSQRVISTGRHCFGCTAGCGSSCGGALI